MASSLVSTHMEKHTKPIIQQHVSIEVLPNAMRTVTESLGRVEKNMNRLDRLLGRVLYHVENQFDDEEEIVNMRDVETVFKGHREIRDTYPVVWPQKPPAPRRGTADRGSQIPDHENLPQSQYTILVTPALSATNIIRCGFYPSKPTRCVEARRAETTTDAFGTQSSFDARNVKNHQKSADRYSTVTEPVQQHLIPCKEVRIEKAGQTDQAAGEPQISWES